MALLVSIPFLVIVTAFVVLGMAATSRATGSAFASWLSGAGKVAQLVGGIGVSLSLSLARWITHSIGAEWKDLERLAVTWLAGLAQWADQVILGALLWPYELSKFAYWLLDVYLPRLFKTIPHAAAQVVHAVTTRVVRVERTIVKLPKLSRATAKALVTAALGAIVLPFLPQLHWLRNHFHALTAVLPRALPIPSVPAIPNLRKRLAKLERVLAVGIGVAAVARALSRLGGGWIRCNKVGRLGRAMCGLDSNLLDALLLDAIAIFSVVSVVEFAKELRTVEDEALGIMGRLVREWPA